MKLSSISNLLCEFIDQTKLNDAFGECDPMDTPLVFLLQRAMEAEAEFKISYLECLETRAYMLPAISRIFLTENFDIGYYMMMGSHAYGHTSKLLREKHEEPTSHLFLELSRKFGRLVDVVADVAERPDKKNSKDILTLYDRWNRTNSERLRKLLHDCGIDPIQSR